ncbi:hypothetical protein C2S52_020928 [Perilla frutescens var. hirtella]|nr:hypothetical protein C2S52_020928 [Perilla frutescens var. hirtella]
MRTDARARVPTRWPMRAGIGAVGIGLSAHKHPRAQPVRRGYRAAKHNPTRSDVGACIGKVRQGKVAVVCWSIWRARNALVWNGQSPRVEVVVFAAKLYLEQWRVAQDKSKVVPSSSSLAEDGTVAWVRPDELSTKVNVNAALFTDRGLFGLGMVARDSSGQLVEARTVCREGVVVPELTEVIGIKEVLSWIKSRR